MTAEYEMVILGGGVTGLAAGLASRSPVFEAREVAGGICASYYIRPGETRRLPAAASDGETYRFEYGGGHWIFGGDPAVLHFIESQAPTIKYKRHSAVYFPESELYVPYPMQNHVSYLGDEIAAKAIAEMISTPHTESATMAEWLEQSFGATLMDRFFAPFHELYTAGLWKQIAPQDSFKSPANMRLVVQGAFNNSSPVGYNVTFVYPVNGLDRLVARMADRCKVHFNMRAITIDPQDKVIEFEDGAIVRYERLISTLPLDRVCEMTGLSVEARPDPYTSVLVINVGGTKGARCPDHHWIYVSASKTGFHRVGFYSNVDPNFLPQSSREAGDRVSIYVEKSYLGGRKPDEKEIAAVCQSVTQELQAWGFIDEAEVVDPTWIDVAYTWSWPASSWKQQALRVLQEHDIHQVGRYGRWVFQGIADSIRDGLAVGAAFSQIERS